MIKNSNNNNNSNKKNFLFGRKSMNYDLKFTHLRRRAIENNKKKEKPQYNIGELIIPINNNI